MTNEVRPYAVINTSITDAIYTLPHRLHTDYIPRLNAGIMKILEAEPIYLHMPQPIPRCASCKKEDI